MQPCCDCGTSILVVGSGRLVEGQDLDWGHRLGTGKLQYVSTNLIHATRLRLSVFAPRFSPLSPSHLSITHESHPHNLALSVAQCIISPLSYAPPSSRMHARGTHRPWRGTGPPHRPWRGTGLLHRPRHGRIAQSRSHPSPSSTPCMRRPSVATLRTCGSAWPTASRPTVSTRHAMPGVDPDFLILLVIYYCRVRIGFPWRTWARANVPFAVNSQGYRCRRGVREGGNGAGKREGGSSACCATYTQPMLPHSPSHRLDPRLCTGLPVAGMMSVCPSCSLSRTFTSTFQTRYPHTLLGDVFACAGRGWGVIACLRSKPSSLFSPHCLFLAACHCHAVLPLWPSP